MIFQTSRSSVNRRPWGWQPGGIWFRTHVSRYSHWNGKSKVILKPPPLSNIISNPFKKHFLKGSFHDFWKNWKESGNPGLCVYAILYCTNWIPPPLATPRIFHYGLTFSTVYSKKSSGYLRLGPIRNTFVGDFPFSIPLTVETERIL